MRKKAAIIGGGFAANLHVAALKSCGIEPAVVVTTRAQTAQSFAAQWNIPVWGTDPALALGPEIDAVHICTPPATHGQFVRLALMAHKDVFCEKPLCLSPAEARELIALAEQTDNRFAVSFNVRYHMAVQRARELIRGGAFGRPLLIHGSYQQEFDVLPAPYDWRYRPALAGDMRAVTEIGSHWIDTAQYVTGKRVLAVSASFMNFFPDRTVADGTMDLASRRPGTPLHVDSEDAACLTLRYEDGAIGTVLLSEISHGRGNRLALEIVCENGSLWWNEEENNVLHTAVRGEGVKSELFAFGNGFSDTFITLVQNFYDGKACPTVREAAQVADVCAAAAWSAAHDSAWKEVTAP